MRGWIDSDAATSDQPHGQNYDRDPEDRHPSHVPAVPIPSPSLLVNAARLNSRLYTVGWQFFARNREEQFCDRDFVDDLVIDLLHVQAVSSLLQGVFYSLGNCSQRHRTRSSYAVFRLTYDSGERFETLFALQALNS